jgi:hypothetical protein
MISEQNIPTNNVAAKPVRSPDVETKILPDGHVVLFCEKSNWAHTLTPVGALVWEFCDGENDLESIITSLGKIKELNGAVGLREETIELLQELTDAGFILED